MIDPTTPGTRAHLRWHKDDSPAALAAYEREFLTHLVTHDYEVVDVELTAPGITTRARARKAIGAGHTHEMQPPTFRNHEGLLGLEGSNGGGMVAGTSAPVD